MLELLLDGGVALAGEMRHEVSTKGYKERPPLVMQNKMECGISKFVRDVSKVKMQQQFLGINVKLCNHHRDAIAQFQVEEDSDLFIMRTRHSLRSGT